MNTPTRQDLTDFLRKLAQAPESQIDSEITDKLYLMSENHPKEVVILLGQILMECCHFPLASDFAKFSIQQAQQMAKDVIKQEELNG